MHSCVANPSRYITRTLLHLRLREDCERRNRKIVRAEDWGVFCESVSSRNGRRLTHKVSPMWLSKNELKGTTDIPKWIE